MQWVSAVSALESNAYRVNERVLEVANTIDKDPKRRLPEGLPNYQEDKAKLDQRYKDEKIDELLAHPETPETFARKIISLTDAVVSKLTGTDVIS